MVIFKLEDSGVDGLGEGLIHVTCGDYRRQNGLIFDFIPVINIIVTLQFIG
jgi:hypothetical protein